MRLIWLRAAVRSRERQIDYIAEHNPDAAARMEQRIVDATDQLLDHPRLGRVGRAPGTRELVVARTPYIVIYEIEGDMIRIVRVLHTVQRWPPIH
jgi:toxin ParE1/3/4